jgi:hypothetical protein
MSAPRKIQQGIVERLQAFPFFSKFTFRKAQSYQVQPADLPYCGVYLLPEVQTADGDWDAGEPRLKSESIVGVSVILRNIQADEMEDALDIAFDIIMKGLLQDPTFIGFRPAGLYDIEGVPKVRRQNVFGTLGSQNETPIGELRCELTFVTKYDYPPNVTDDLDLIVLETAYPSLEEYERVQQVTVPINLQSGSSGDSPDRFARTDQDRDFEWPKVAISHAPDTDSGGTP